ncbi:MAG: YidC/Oxa1 family insertase periplasmic-domain containing protein [Candidatus Omnitrophica bacterium]|nr:YidC/Oxa1 family insertase periplasmic-domain containing protein [Candidatus Omnitrophota bacterium]
MKEETRIFIAFALSLAVIVLFSMMPSWHNKKDFQSQGPKYPASDDIEKIDNFQISEKKTKIKNGLYTAEIDLLGGKIVSFSLERYTRPGEKSFIFFQRGNTLLDLVNGETQQLVYQKIENVTENSLVLSAKRNGVEIEKLLQFSPSKYSMNVFIKLKNSTDKTVSIPGLTLSLGSVPLDRKNPEDASIEFMVVNNGKPTKFNVARQMKEKFSGTTCSVRTRYQMYYFKTEQPVEFYVESKSSIINWGIHIQSFEIDKSQEWKFPLTMYIGPSDYFIAKNEIKDIRIFGTGFFVSMGRFIFYILSSIHKVIPNWGFAIIVLTILIKLIFFPLTRSSLRSMKQIQKLRPYLQDIQKKYKDNPQLMQKEMMNLYKTYKINPFGGCLPMLVQIPIFVGFFLALRNSIYLRGSGFILWIKDLSLPDTVARIGSIPINILPVLMFITSFLQQRLTPAVDQSQKIMNVVLPLMMLVLFYNFSSGLLLYWVTMNIAGLVEQYYIYKIAKR